MHRGRALAWWYSLSELKRRELVKKYKPEWMIAKAMSDMDTIQMIADEEYTQIKQGNKK